MKKVVVYLLVFVGLILLAYRVYDVLVALPEPSKEPDHLSSNVPQWATTDPVSVPLQSGTYARLSEFVRVNGVKKDPYVIEYTFPESITIVDLIETEDDTLLAVWSPVPTDTLRCKYGCRMFYSIKQNDSASASVPDARKNISLIRPTIDSMLVRISR